MSDNSSAAKASQLLSLKKQLMGLRFQKASGELKDTSKIRRLKKEVARFYTTLNMK
ncbi:50S ribosomal protein L29 [Candidatus Lariskella endosymbiont of Hedychridium roseum]|uniref:50S ribosomal protein L29 n=1 Tax=Candidatus Lariskella endosymbiont of Hedychridium roseum TaxID=3077949 RepID=UPI0039774F8F